MAFYSYRWVRFCVGFALYVGLVWVSPVLAAEASKPNVIVIFTDDHGWPDLGAQGIQHDVKTPNLDALASGGMRASNGYVTAPQCVPSRGGLLSGQYQNRFGLESNPEFTDPVVMGRFNQLSTLPERLKTAGYATGMAGKWHLGPDDQIADHGFDHIFHKHSNAPGYWNMNLDGNDVTPGKQTGGYHLDLVADFACTFIRRYHEQPFFFYAAFRGPHTPLDAPEKYTSRFPGEMPERRRQALAMISAIDDGVGRIMTTLRERGIEEQTLIFFMGDNGAPLKITKTDSPLKGDPGGWDGSLNEPMNGEKGMLSEGGIRVPWIAYWKNTIPGGQVFEHPVISLDVAATATELAGVPAPAGELDGVNLIPHFRGQTNSAPHDAIYWRWIAQGAIREGDWKLLRGGDREYLFNLASDPEEKHNLASQYPELVSRLRDRLAQWSETLTPPGLSTAPMAMTWENYFDFYLEGKQVPESVKKPRNGDSTGGSWIAREATLTQQNDSHVLTTLANAKSCFIARNGLRINGPAVVKLRFKTTTVGAGSIAWRTVDEKDFVPANRVSFPIETVPDWQTHEVTLPGGGQIIHLRLHFPAGVTAFTNIQVESGNGRTVTLLD